MIHLLKRADANSFLIAIFLASLFSVSLENTVLIVSLFLYGKQRGHAL